jgi:hypothetical protein
MEKPAPGAEGVTFTTQGVKVRLEATNYFNGRLAFLAVIVDGEKKGRPWGKLTVNIPEARLEPGEFCVRTWDGGEILAADAMATGAFEDTGKRVPTGHVEAAVWRVKAKEGA